MRVLRKRLACGEGRVRAVFFGMRAGKHRKGSDSEKLSFEPEAHQPLAGLLHFLWHQRKKRSNKFNQNEIASRGSFGGWPYRILER